MTGRHLQNYPSLTWPRNAARSKCLRRLECVVGIRGRLLLAGFSGSRPGRLVCRPKMFGAQRQPSSSFVPAADSHARSAMSGKFFLDASLLTHAIDPTDPGKQAVAQK